VLVICTIHQPAYETFSLFDRLLLLARGKVMFDGPTSDLDRYLVDIGSPTPEHVNPVDQVVDLVSTDFLPAPTSSGNSEKAASSSPTSSHLVPDHAYPTADEHVDRLAALWAAWAARNNLVRSASPSRAGDEDLHARSHGRAAALVGLRKTLALSHRNILNYARNVLAYGIRRASPSSAPSLSSFSLVRCTSDTWSPRAQSACTSAWRSSSRPSGSTSAGRPRSSTTA